MSEAIIRVWEGYPLPAHALSPRVLLMEDIPSGSGTSTRRVYTLAVTDGRYWLSDEDKRATPLGAST